MERLKKSDKAIAFNSTDYLGADINLTDYKGKRLLLSFFRGAACPFCNLRVNQLINGYPQFEHKGIRIVSFFAASKKDISRYAGQQNAPFPIIPDPNLEIYLKYGVEQSVSGMAKAMVNPLKMIRVMRSGFFNMKSIKDKPILPADFLIDGNQMVSRAYYGKDFGDHLPISDILAWKE